MAKLNGLTKIEVVLENNAKGIETPCYIYDIEQTIHNYTKLKERLGTELITSIKANTCLELLVRCQHVCKYLEVASLQELHSVVGGDNRIFLNSPAYDEKIIRAALASKATLVIDNLMQLQVLSKLIARAEVKPIMLRLNNRVIRRFCTDDVHFRQDHFGMDWDTVAESIQQIKHMNIKLLGIHIFNGSYTFGKLGMQTLTVIKPIITEIESIYGGPLSFVNLGGGFSEHWEAEERDFSDYRKMVCDLPSHIQYAHESGRGIFASAGYYLTKVIYTKQIDSKVIAVCDGGLSHNYLLAQLQNPFKKYKVPYLWRDKGLTKLNDKLFVESVLVGPSCSQDDVFGILPPEHPSPQPGDIYIFDDCGAYNYTYSVSRFLSLHEAKQYVIP